MNKSSKSFFNSLNFKSWLYFVLFALSIILMLLFFQIIMLEPFYKDTLKRDILTLNENIYEISFRSGDDNETKTTKLYELTSKNNACIVIYNTETTNATAYDVLGENGCAIYQQGTVNPKIIEEIASEESHSYFSEGRLLEFSNQEVMIAAEKYIVNDTEYYIISNFALQDMNNVVRTTISQSMVISLIILSLSLVISYIFSRILSRPIVDIKNEAVKLAQGNYDVKPVKEGINEVDDLSETLVLAASELSKIEETRKELIANVSHDLKTPLTMIKAYAEMIKDISGSNKEKRLEHLDVIISETDRLNVLVSDMLNLSKLQAGVDHLEMAPFDLSSSINETVARFTAISHEESIIFEVNCEPELIANGDINKINEVVYNFITNAIKHIGDDKKVIVNCYSVSRNIARVEVIDHGPGIPDDVLPHIWDRYYKNDRLYQRAQSGSGLGLAINKAILEDHKSDYGVETEVGEGSKFFFELERVLVDDL